MRLGKKISDYLQLSIDKVGEMHTWVLKGCVAQVHSTDDANNDNTEDVSRILWLKNVKKPTIHPK